MRKNNLKIQILAGSTLMARFHVGFEIELPFKKIVNVGIFVTPMMKYLVKVFPIGNWQKFALLEWPINWDTRIKQILKNCS